LGRNVAGVEDSTAIGFSEVLLALEDEAGAVNKGADVLEEGRADLGDEALLADADDLVDIAEPGGALAKNQGGSRDTGSPDHPSTHRHLHGRLHRRRLGPGRRDVLRESPHGLSRVLRGAPRVATMTPWTATRDHEGKRSNRASVADIKPVLYSLISSDPGREVGATRTS
jgi:hypothetical protein